MATGPGRGWLSLAPSSPLPGSPGYRRTASSRAPRPDWLPGPLSGLAAAGASPAGGYEGGAGGWLTVGFRVGGRRVCDRLTQDQGARTAAAQPGTHRRAQAPPGHARREQRAGRRPQLSGGPRLPLLPGSAWVRCPPPGPGSGSGSGSGRGPRRVPEGRGRLAWDARGRPGGRGG